MKITRRQELGIKRRKLYREIREDIRCVSELDHRPGGLAMIMDYLMHPAVGDNGVRH